MDYVPVVLQEPPGFSGPDQDCSSNRACGPSDYPMVRAPIVKSNHCESVLWDTLTAEVPSLKDPLTTGCSAFMCESALAISSTIDLINSFACTHARVHTILLVLLPLPTHWLIYSSSHSSCFRDFLYYLCCCPNLKQSIILKCLVPPLQSHHQVVLTSHVSL